MLEDAGPGALVLVDELGKGTEARAGTALAAAFLERLAQDSCRGMFATYVPPCPPNLFIILFFLHRSISRHRVGLMSIS